jgi:hypothetical protein
MRRFALYCVLAISKVSMNSRFLDGGVTDTSVGIFYTFGITYR